MGSGIHLRNYVTFEVIFILIIQTSKGKSGKRRKLFVNCNDYWIENLIILFICIYPYLFF